MYKYRIAVLLLALGSILCNPALAFEHAQDSLPQYGRVTKSSDIFSRTYHTNDLVYYLDNLDLYSTYLTETTGQYNMPDQLVFSLDGNSFKWNSYYIDGFRIDSRFFAGSTLYTPDLYTHDLSIDYIGSDIYFDTNADAPDFVAASYNAGGLSKRISAGTKELINLFHLSASERLYKPIEHRNKMTGAGTAQADFTIKGKKGNYRQSVYANFGERQQVYFDQEGINDFVPEMFGQLQLRGALPLTLGRLFDRTNYLLNYKGRENLYSEFYYNLNETAAHHAYSASFYGSKQGKQLSYTSGVTFAAHTIEHANLEYARNMIDQDGEGFSPFYTDGTSYELSHALNLNQKLTPWLDLTFDSYNSFLYNAPSTTEFTNTTYYQHLGVDHRTPLHIYEWETKAFASGLLENTLGLHAEKRLNRTFMMRADLNLTLDALLLSKNSMLRPNFEAQLGFEVRPCPWFNMEVNVGKRRVTYNIDHVRFLSDDYMNANIYYINDRNNDGHYQEGERGTLYATTGGKYHSTIKGLRQPSYLFVDIPIHFIFGRHTISALCGYRKHYNVWRTHYDQDPSHYGMTTDAPNFSGSEPIRDVFFLHGGQETHYEVGYYPEGSMGNDFFTATPYYLSANVQYKYTGRKFMLSLAWQSVMMAGLSSGGNGPISNNLGELSELSANPNSLITANNQDSPHQASGRMDQDKAYVLKMIASYNITKNFSLSTTWKFKDGQPFSIFHTCTQTDANGNNQLAIFPQSTRGINTHDGNFGTREDAFFNIDLRATYRCKIAKRDFEAQLTFYNMYDFGTELTEYVFDQNLPDKRRAMSLNIPKGLIATLKYNL